VRRRIEFDAETWHALHKLSLDSNEVVAGFADKPSETAQEGTGGQPH